MTPKQDFKDEDDGEHDADATGVHDPDDSDFNDEPAEVECPYCKREIPEEAERCPRCGSYILREDQNRGGRKWWWVIAVILLVLLLMRYLLRW